jgi:hypothetical protein
LIYNLTKYAGVTVMNIHLLFENRLLDMAQIFDPLPLDESVHIVCCYVNVTSRIQVVRITNIPNWYFERVVFPGQRLVFEALPEATLEVHCGMMASAILSDTILCENLRVVEEDSPLVDFREQQRLENQNEGSSSESGTATETLAV